MAALHTCAEVGIHLTDKPRKDVRQQEILACSKTDAFGVRSMLLVVQKVYWPTVAIAVVRSAGGSPSWSTSFDVCWPRTRPSPKHVDERPVQELGRAIGGCHHIPLVPERHQYQPTRELVASILGR